MAAFEGDNFILDLVLKYIGSPYQWGGATPLGFDCSGLVLEVLRARGLVSNSFDATAHNIFIATKSGGVLKPEVHALAFFGGKQRVTHVGYCISPEFMVEAGGGGANTTSLEMAVKQNAFVRLRPIFSRKDLLAIHVPDKTHFT